MGPPIIKKDAAVPGGDANISGTALSYFVFLTGSCCIRHLFYDGFLPATFLEVHELE